MIYIYIYFEWLKKWVSSNLCMLLSFWGNFYLEIITINLLVVWPCDTLPTCYLKSITLLTYS